MALVLGSDILIASLDFRECAHRARQVRRATDQVEFRSYAQSAAMPLQFLQNSERELRIRKLQTPFSLREQFVEMVVPTNL